MRKKRNQNPELKKLIERHNELYEKIVVYNVGETVPKDLADAYRESFNKLDKYVQRGELCISF